MTALFDRIAILGLGLLGGSLGLAARQRRVARTVVGFSRRPETVARAAASGVVDEGCRELADALQQAELVVLAAPLERTAALVEAAAPHLAPGCVLTDVGSVKGSLADTLPGLLGPGACFVGAHPMAGSHHRGLDFADPRLFDGAVCIVTPTRDTPAPALDSVRRFWEALGSRVVQREPAAHDREVGWVSHLPHAVAFAFAAALEAAPESARELEGAGFRDFTRIARSDPELWAEILIANRKALVEPLRSVGERMEELARRLEAEDAGGVERFIQESRESLAQDVVPDGKGDGETTMSAARQGARGNRSNENHS